MIITRLKYISVMIFQTYLMRYHSIYCNDTISVYLAKIIAPLTLKLAERTDDRLRLMNQVITGLQVIKMYVWEIPFYNLVEKARK